MRLLAGALAAIVSGVLLALATTLDPYWWAAWLAPIPLLVAAFRSSLWQSWLWSAIAALVGLAGQFTYVLMFVGPVGMAIIAIASVVLTGLGVTLTRVMVKRDYLARAIFFYPAGLAGAGTLLQFWSPDGTAGSLAYSQVHFLPAIQVASLAGTAGIVFIVGLFGSLVAVALHARATSRHYPLIYGAPAIVIVAALAFGIWRLDAGEDARSLPVGLAVNDLASPQVRTPIDSQDSVWKIYALTLHGLAESGAKLVVWPEKIAPLDAPAAERVRKLLGDAARDNKIYLLTGLTLLGDGQVDNRAWLFAPTGELVADYSKQHLVPGFETPRFTPGHQDAVTTIESAPLGIAICKDMDFDRLGRRYSAQGVGAMLVPAWDFDDDAWQHASMAVLRGVEGGFTVIRSARHGLLTVSDRFGRVLDRKESGDAVVVTLQAAAPLGPGEPTPYARYGYWFGWLCAIFAVLAALSLLLPRRRA